MLSTGDLASSYDAYEKEFGNKSDWKIIYFDAKLPKIANFEFTWPVENYSLNSGDGVSSTKRIKSPKFFCEDFSQFKFNLILFPNVKKGNNFLALESSKKIWLLLKCSILEDSNCIATTACKLYLIYCLQ